MNRESAGPATLLTFEPMVNSQCARLLLAYYQVPYRERDHMFGWGSVLSLFRTGKALLPVLYGNGLNISSPRPMAEHFDSALPPERRLIPPEGDPLRAEVEKDWQLYNEGMGAWTAEFAYFHLLPQRKLMTRIFAAPVPRIEAKLTRPLYPLLSGLLKLGLKLNAERAEQARGKILEAFDSTDRRIADGRRYLNGDRITLSDFALASASAEVLLPKGYLAAMPAIHEMAPPLRSVVEELRRRPTAAFVERLHDEHPVAATASA